MAIDTKIQETLKNYTRTKNMRRGGSPEPSCQLPTAPAHTSLIPLTQGQFAIVDTDKYEWLMQWKWCAQWSNYTKSFYALRGQRENGKHRLIYMAREILKLKYGDKRQSDHKNHNTLDNRRSNLRIVTHQQNHFNQKNTKGYCWHKASKKYQSYIGLNGKRIHLGCFRTTKEAHKSYLQAKKVYHNIQTEIKLCVG